MLLSLSSLLAQPEPPKKRGRPSTKHLKEFAGKLYPNFPKPSQLKTFYAQVGKTNSTWQLVEKHLYDVLHRIIMPSRPGAHAAAFFAVPSFRAKLNLTHASIQFALFDKPDLLKEWQAIYNKAGRKADRRNEIVHGMIYTEFNEKVKERKVYVAPIINDTRDKIPAKQPNTKPEPLTLRRLKEYEKDFRTLARSMREFSRRIPLPPEPSQEQAQTQRG